MKPGNLITFRYNKTGINDKQPNVLVLGIYNEKLHGININYLTSSQIKRLKSAFDQSSLANYFRSKKNISESIEKDPLLFYNNYVKKFMRVINTNCYRTYNIKNIKNVKIMDEIIKG